MPIFRLLTLFLLPLILSSPSHAYQQIELIKEIGAAEKKAKQRQLNAPRAIALAGEKVYIADTDAHRVVVLDREGKTVRTWGAKGEKRGQFRSPAGIAVDERGRVFVADTGNHRIQVFDAEGKFIMAFGTKGGGTREFSSPSGLAAGSGFLFVADSGNSRVQVLSVDGIFIKEIAPKGKKNEMKEPVALAVDLKNRIYVLDSKSNMVGIFNHDGKELELFGVESRGSDGFDQPLGLAVDGNGGVYVADTGNYKLKKFDSQGKLTASFGSEGAGPGQFGEATGLAVDKDGRIYVLDAQKNTLQIFSWEAVNCAPAAAASPPPSIELIKEIPGAVAALAVNNGVWALSGDSLSKLGVPGVAIGSRGSEPGKLRKARGLAVDPAGNFWVADTGNDRLQKFSPDGALLQVVGKSGSGEGQFDSPSGIAIDQKGNIYVADTGNERVQAFSPQGILLGRFGTSGKQAGQFRNPVDIAVDATDHLYVADRGNDRIAKYTIAGKLVWEKGTSGAQNGEFNAPSNILVSADSEVYVLDSGNGRVQVFDTNGNFLRKFGSAGKGRGQFRSPQGLALEDGLKLAVGDPENERVQIFGLRQTPATPQGLSAQAGINEIQLSWKSNTESYLEQYSIYRSESQTGPFTRTGTSKEIFYMDKNLPSNKTFYYRIAGKARDGNESASSPAVASTTLKLIPETPKKIKIEAHEKQITLSWLPGLEPFIDHYRIYRTTEVSSGFELLAKSDRTVFIDAAVDPEIFYYYQLTAVGKEGDESPPTEAVYAMTPKPAFTLPPLEIASIELGAVFAAAYKYYESHPLGKVIVRNNTGQDYARLKLTFSIKEFMDFPTEIGIEQIPAGQTAEMNLKPVFNNKILEVTENTPIQSEFALTYYLDGEAKTITRSFPVTLYERHAMVWDRKEKLGAFVTPKDPPVADLSRGIIRPYVEAYANLHQTIVYARTIYGALGVLGLKYIIDPTSPFQEFSEKSASVDYLQYPRDTLSRKSGDCDDLSVLFAALLENIGIGTAFVDVPAHVFVMFNTGVPETDKASLGFPDPLIVLHEGTVWIPVEMTMVGSSFSKAWQKAAEEYREWSAKGKLEIVNTQKAWELFKPVTLPPNSMTAAKVTKEEVEELFKDELESLGRQRLASLSARYLDVLKKQPDNTAALGRLGILYGENGLLSEALEQFQKILAADKSNSLALNNIGNINFLQDRFEDAKTAYEASLAAAPEDAGTMANLARVLLRTGKKEEARKQFQAALATDPRVLRQYGDIARSLGIKK